MFVLRQIIYIHLQSYFPQLVVLCGHLWCALWCFAALCYLWDILFHLLKGAVLCELLFICMCSVVLCGIFCYALWYFVVHYSVL